MTKITDANDSPDMKALRKAARDPRVREIEGTDMDEGRVGIYLMPGYWFRLPYGVTGKSVGDAEQIAYVMSLIERKPS